MVAEMTCLWKFLKGEFRDSARLELPYQIRGPEESNAPLRSYHATQLGIAVSNTCLLSSRTYLRDGVATAFS